MIRYRHLHPESPPRGVSNFIVNNTLECGNVESYNSSCLCSSLSGQTDISRGRSVIFFVFGAVSPAVNGLLFPYCYRTMIEGPPTAWDPPEVPYHLIHFQSRGLLGRNGEAMTTCVVRSYQALGCNLLAHGRVTFCTEI